MKLTHLGIFKSLTKLKNLRQMIPNSRIQCGFTFLNFLEIFIIRFSGYVFSQDSSGPHYLKMHF